jgi:hypothetical protein
VREGSDLNFKITKKALFDENETKEPEMQKEVLNFVPKKKVPKKKAQNKETLDA